MTSDEIAARADENYYAMHQLVGLRHPRGQLHARGGLFWMTCGEPIAEFNVAFVTQPLADPDAQLAAAVAEIEATALPFVVRIRDGLDPAAERALEALGIPYSDTVPGMALTDMDAVPDPPAGIEIRIARSDDELAAHRRVGADGFGMPVDAIERIFSDDLLRSQDVEVYVGYDAGEPVCTSVLINAARVAGVYSVATLPSHRGRGYGEAMTWQCVRRGREQGRVMSALQASTMGRPIYERMGYRLVSEYRTYHR